MFFLGDFRKPIAIGKKGELWKNLDNEFFEILEIWRWFRIGMLKVDIENLPCNLALGLRVLCENERIR